MNSPVVPGQGVALTTLLESIRKVNGVDLDATVAVACPDYAPELFLLGKAIFEANPELPAVPAPAQARVVIRSATRPDVAAVRFLRAQFPMSLKEAVDFCRGHDKVPYQMEPLDAEIARQVAQNWRGAGFVVDLVPVPARAAKPQALQAELCHQACG